MVISTKTMEIDGTVIQTFRCEDGNIALLLDSEEASSGDF